MYTLVLALDISRYRWFKLPDGKKYNKRPATIELDV